MSSGMSVFLCIVSFFMCYLRCVCYLLCVLSAFSVCYLGCLVFSMCYMVCLVFSVCYLGCLCSLSATWDVCDPCDCLVLEVFVIWMLSGICV